MSGGLATAGLTWIRFAWFDLEIVFDLALRATFLY